MKIHKLSRTLNLLLVVLVLSYFIPKYYWMKFEENFRPPFVAYSTILRDFIITDNSGPSTVLHDLKGHVYLRTEYEKLLPLQNYRQLSWTGQFPDSLNGVALDLKTVARNNVTLRVRPENIGAPQIQLYPLFESESGRLKLELPDNFFRITNRIEFIKTSDNTVNEEMSRKFTEKLNEAGFTFPAKLIAGNPNERKPFDEGYFISDAAGRLFHMKMRKGEPSVKKAGLPENIKIKYMQISENELKEFYGVLISESDEIFLITYNNYRLVKLPAGNYNPAKDNLIFIGDLFNRTITIQSDSAVTTVAADRRYNVVGKYHTSLPVNEKMLQGRVADFLMPFRLTFFESSDFVSLNFSRAGFYGIWGIVISFILALLLLWYRHRNLKDNWTDLLLVLLTGIYGLIAVSLIKNDDLHSNMSRK